MNDRQAATLKTLTAAFSTELRRWMEDMKTGNLTVSVSMLQGGVRDNKFTVTEERKAE